MKKIRSYCCSSIRLFHLFVCGVVGLFIVVAAQPRAAAQTSSPPAATTTSPANAQSTTAVSSSAAPAEDNRYRIGPGDVLDIRYYNRPQLSREAVRVDGHGMIRMPLIEGEIMAACLTESELGTEIASRYLKYYRNPHVDVFIKEYQSEPVAVIGAVNSPGRFQLQRRVRLLELLAFAGGPAERAGRVIQVVHGATTSLCVAPKSDTVDSNDAAKFVSYKLSDTLRGDEEANPFAQPGDVITLPEADQVYVVGNVFKPSAIALKEPITVSRAIAMAGGAMRDTKTDRVRIVRQVAGSTTKTEIYVDLRAIDRRQAEDVALQANDIVDVPTSAGKSFLRSLVSTVAPAVGQLPVRVVP